MALKLVYNIEPASPSMISSLDRHCLVREPDGSSNIVTERSHLNRILEGHEDGLTASLKALYASGVKKPTAQAEKPYLRIVLSASPEYFRPGDPGVVGTWDVDRLAAWEEATMNPLRAEHGDDLIFAELHLDEDTPHIHAVVAPTYLRKARVPGKQKRGETPEQFEDRKAAARASDGIRTVGRASHPTLSKQGSFQRLRERMTVAVDHLGIEYGEDRVIDAPAGQATAQYGKNEAARIRAEQAELERERKALAREREDSLNEALERQRMIERTGKLAEEARSKLMETAKANATDAEKRAVEAEERLKLAQDTLKATEAAQSSAESAAQRLRDEAERKANRMLEAAEKASQEAFEAAKRMRREATPARFKKLEQENVELRKANKSLNDFVDSIRNTLSAALGDRWEALKKKINDAWKADPRHPNYKPKPPSQSYSSGPSGP
jgi:chemotaxis protein histidine kinase CheA